MTCRVTSLLGIVISFLPKSGDEPKGLLTQVRFRPDMTSNKKARLDLGEDEELADLLEEIDLLLRHVIFRIRERDPRIFKRNEKNPAE